VLSRSTPIGEEDGGEHAVRRDGCGHSGEELLDFVEDLIRVVPRNVILSAELAEAGSGNPVGDVAPFVCTRIAVSRAMEDERRTLDAPK
jgi:hypothetical protein